MGYVGPAASNALRFGFGALTLVAGYVAFDEGKRLWL